MRFSAPRSISPSPVRSYSAQQKRRSSTFGLYYGSDDDSEENADDDSDILTPTDSDSDLTDESTSSDSLFDASQSEVEVPPARRIGRTLRPPAEERAIEDTVASIRLRTRHQDIYEDWEKEIRKDAFKTARQSYSSLKSELENKQDSVHRNDSTRQALLHAKQMREVEGQLQNMRLQQQSREKQLKERWKERDRKLWEQIDRVIKFEEEQLRLRLEAERKKREEEERRKREEEERRRQEEERKRKEEEQLRLQKEKEDEERRKQEELQRQRAAQLAAEAEGRKELGLSTSAEDWANARKILKNLKEGPMKAVKSNKELKSQWSTLRRQITPKIGQITNDAQAISRITQQLRGITGAGPSSPHLPEIYYAALSSLAKAILLQAETEVTAEKRSAIPLAAVTVNLIATLPGFGEIFFAKLMQRAGGWTIPAAVPAADVDGTPWPDDVARARAMGYRLSGERENELESAADYSSRVAGMMRVYFHVLHTPVSQPLDKRFQMPRYWAYFARMLNEPQLLDRAVAPQVLYAALDVGGMEARNIWGRQWVKMLSLLYEGATSGLNGSSERVIGGQTPEGKAARVRLQLEIERIMSSPA